MIKSTNRTNIENKQENTNKRVIENHTTEKQRQSFSRWNQEMSHQQLAQKMNYSHSQHNSDSNQEQIEIPIQDIIYTYEVPITGCRSASRFRMNQNNKNKIKHVPKIENKLITNSIRSVSEGYYNQAVANETQIFLNQMCSLLSKQEESIRQKRRQIVESVVATIHKRWQFVKKDLIELVGAWSYQCEESQINQFLKSGQLKISGELIELNNRITSKREEVEIFRLRLQDIKKQQKVISEQELVQRGFSIKNILKEIWEKQYELTVGSMSSYVKKVKAIANDKQYYYKHIKIRSDQLHREIDELMKHKVKFYQVIPEQKQMVQNIKDDQINSVKANLTQQKLTESLYESRLLQLTTILTQRQQQLEQMINSRHK